MTGSGTAHGIAVDLRLFDFHAAGWSVASGGCKRVGMLQYRYVRPQTMRMTPSMC